MPYRDYAYLQNYNRIDYTNTPETENPKGLFYVVNDERNPETGAYKYPETQLLQDSVNVLLLAFADEEHRHSIIDWITSGRIRKIVKRARGKKWEQYVSLEDTVTYVSPQGSSISIHFPTPMSEQPTPLRRLQVSGLEYPHEVHSPKTPLSKKLAVTFNDTLHMTTGKKIAQLGHAVQLFLMVGDPQDVHDWLESGHMIEVVPDSFQNKEKLISVKDAGYTEVPSGSVTTVVSYLP